MISVEVGEFAKGDSGSIHMLDGNISLSMYAYHPNKEICVRFGSRNELYRFQSVLNELISKLDHECEKDTIQSRT
jgi:hypothetical protein